MQVKPNLIALSFQTCSGVRLTYLTEDAEINSAYITDNLTNSIY